MNDIAIYGIGCVSALGSDSSQSWEHYRCLRPALTRRRYAQHEHWVGVLDLIGESELESLAAQNRNYRRLDRSILMAIFSARRAMLHAGWQDAAKLAVQFGSSRGATQTLEMAHQTFLESGKVTAATSPITTLGSLAGWVGQDLRANGAQIEHSVTCSTGLHGLINSYAWLKAGMAERFVVGASEAPLTQFGLAQMRALGLYADNSDPKFPCRPLDLHSNQNTLVLGEGACALCVGKADLPRPLAVIAGVGYATEPLTTPTSITPDGEAFLLAMQMALGSHTKPGEVDLIVMHAPGTVLGDRAELNAVSDLFSENVPALFSTKWALGHTFAPSGLFSLEYALNVLQHRMVTALPYQGFRAGKSVPAPNKILINAAGFGGNAASILLQRP